MLKEKVLKTVKDYNMLQPGDTVVVAVSGGPDSVALLYLLKSLSRQFKLKLHIAHLNHMFRGHESDKDAEFVRGLARRLRLPLSVESIDVPAEIKRAGGSKEDIARRIRYEFLEEVAREVKAKKIATAHTQDDQAETVLMRLLYGAGIAGLSGIPPTRKCGRQVLIRPLLDVSKRDLLKFLKRRRIKWRVDSFNLKAIYKRNKIRLELLPYLEKKYNPKIKETLGRSAEALRGDHQLLQDKILKKVFAKYKKTSVNIKDFKKLSSPLQKHLLRELILRTKGDTRGIEYRHWQKLDEFLKTKGAGKIMHLPGACRAKIGKGRLIFYRAGAEKKRSAAAPKAKISIAVLSKRPSQTGLKRYPNIKYLDLAKIRHPFLHVRTRRPGDRFMPLGMKRAKN